MYCLQISLLLGSVSGLLGNCRSGKEDLALARANFKTELIKKLPSPQDYSFYFPPGDARLIYYTSGDLRLKAWLSEKPQDEQKLPGIVFAHGGFSFGLSDWEEIKPFIEARFIVLAPMFRGENGNPGFFEFFYGEVDDLIAAGEYLAQLRYVDKERVYLAGYSSGGTLALLCSMLKNPYKAIITIGASPDQTLFFNSYWQAYVPFDLEREQEVSLRSPIEYVASIKTPLFLLVGEMDFIYKEKSLLFVRLAENLHKPCEMEILIGDHFTSMEKAIYKSIEIFKR
jgi:dipeptidyl aminopeptidase/acylaminoacyl peptidase